MQSFRQSFLPGSGAAGSVSPRSYGAFGARFRHLRSRAARCGGRHCRGRHFAAAAVVLPARAAERPVRIVALGDSLTAGYGLGGRRAFPARLEKALAAKGLAVEIVNAGVSGDTATGGLARLDWSVPEGADARDRRARRQRHAARRRPARSRARRSRRSCAGSSERAHRRAARRHAGGAQSRAPTMGASSRRSIPISPRSYDALLYPFFLDGVAGDAELNQRDGIHPTAAGVDGSSPASCRGRGAGGAGAREARLVTRHRRAG